MCSFYLRLLSDNNNNNDSYVSSCSRSGHPTCMCVKWISPVFFYLWKATVFLSILQWLLFFLCGKNRNVRKCRNGCLNVCLLIIHSEWYDATEAAFLKLQLWIMCWIALTLKSLQCAMQCYSGIHAFSSFKCMALLSTNKQQPFLWGIWVLRCVCTQ